MNKILSKRKFLQGFAATAAVTAVSSFPKPAISKGIRRWKMVMPWQKVLPGLGTGAVRLAKRISTLSEGRIEVVPYGGGELVPALGVFDAVSEGTAEMAHSASYYWLSKSKSCAFFCCVPCGMTNQEQNGWLYFGGGKALWDELYDRFGLIAFPAGNTGCQMGGWYNRELKSLSDIKGLKMRMPGLGGEVFSRLGGSAQVIPPQELFTAMQSGVVDALEWVGPWNDIALGFHKVSKYYYGPAFQEPAPTLELMINKKAYMDLPKDLQTIIKIASATENEVMPAEYHANNIRAFHVLRQEYNVDVRKYPKEILKAFFDESRQVVQESASAGALERRIFDSYSDYRQKSKDMSPYTELAFLQGREYE